MPPLAGQVGLQRTATTGLPRSLTITAGRGPRLSGVDTAGKRRKPISAHTTAAPNRSSRSRPDRVTSPDQSGATELTHGQPRADEAEAEDDSADRPVAVREVHVADKEEHRRHKADRKGEQNVSRW